MQLTVQPPLSINQPFSVTSQNTEEDLVLTVNNSNEPTQVKNNSQETSKQAQQLSNIFTATIEQTTLAQNPPQDLADYDHGDCTRKTRIIACAVSTGIAGIVGVGIWLIVKNGLNGDGVF